MQLPVRERAREEGAGLHSFILPAPADCSLVLIECSYSYENAPVKKELAATEVGAVAAFLCSPLASAGAWLG